MQLTKQVELTLKDAPAGILATVVDSENHGHRLRQTGDRLGKAQIPITEITHKQHPVGIEVIEQLGVLVTPIAMQIPCDRNPEP